VSSSQRYGDRSLSTAQEAAINICTSEANGARSNSNRNEPVWFRVQLDPCQALAYESSSLAFFPSSIHHLHRPNQLHNVNSGRVAFLFPCLPHRVLKEGMLGHVNLKVPSQGCGSFLGKEVLRGIAHMWVQSNKY